MRFKLIFITFALISFQLHLAYGDTVKCSKLDVPINPGNEVKVRQGLDTGKPPDVGPPDAMPGRHPALKDLPDSIDFGNNRFKRKPDTAGSFPIDGGDLAFVKPFNKKELSKQQRAEYDRLTGDEKKAFEEANRKVDRTLSRQDVRHVEQVLKEAQAQMQKGQRFDQSTLLQRLNVHLMERDLQGWSAVDLRDPGEEIHSRRVPRILIKEEGGRIKWRLRFDYHK